MSVYLHFKKRRSLHLQSRKEEKGNVVWLYQYVPSKKVVCFILWTILQMYLEKIQTVPDQSEIGCVVEYKKKCRQKELTKD